MGTATLRRRLDRLQAEVADLRGMVPAKADKTLGDYGDPRLVELVAELAGWELEREAIWQQLVARVGVPAGDEPEMKQLQVMRLEGATQKAGEAYARLMRLEGRPAPFAEPERAWPAAEGVEEPVDTPVEARDKVVEEPARPERLTRAEELNLLRLGIDPAQLTSGNGHGRG